MKNFLKFRSIFNFLTKKRVKSEIISAINLKNRKNFKKYL